MKETILSIIGLFFPVAYDERKKRYVFTMQIGGIPLGWIILVISAIATFIDIIGFLLIVQ